MRYLFLLPPLREGRQKARRGNGTARKISTRAPTRGATRCRHRSSPCGTISTRAPTRGATLPEHSRAGVLGISTRAPTRGATGYGVRFGHRAAISTRAPTRGATPRPSQARQSTSYFYSRPYTRGDAGSAIVAWHSMISTRAPTRGATSKQSVIIDPPRIFLLAPLHEGRPYGIAVQMISNPHFYSRPYTRGDHPASHDCGGR